MQARASADQKQDARHETSSRSPQLDDRYGKIGIPAVAAAVRCRSEERKAHRAGRLTPQESD